MTDLLTEATTAYESAVEALSACVLREDAEGYSRAFPALTQARRDLESLGVLRQENHRPLNIPFLALDHKRREYGERGMIRDKRAQALASDRPCTICGAPFRPTQLRGRVATICSDECRRVNKANHSRKLKDSMTPFMGARQPA